MITLLNFARYGQYHYSPVATATSSNSKILLNWSCSICVGVVYIYIKLSFCRYMFESWFVDSIVALLISLFDGCPWPTDMGNISNGMFTLIAGDGWWV